MKLREIPASFGVDVVRDGDFATLGFVTHHDARMLVFAEDAKYVPNLAANEQVTCVITNAELAASIPATLGVGVVASPREAFYRFHNHLAETDFYWTPFASEIAASAKVHPRAYVAESNVRIGERCIIEPNATILERCILEDDCIVRAGTVIGGEGFQFARTGGVLLSVRHGGGVRLERGVEVRCNTCVDRATFGGFTVVGEETKIDNGVHIAHNVRLGKRNLVVAGAMVAGSVVTGDDVWIGPLAAVSDGLEVGARASVTLGAVVTKDVPAGARVSGNFAIEHTRFIAHMKSIRGPR